MNLYIFGSLVSLWQCLEKLVMNVSVSRFVMSKNKNKHLNFLYYCLLQEIGHVDVQSRLLIIFQHHQSACSTLDWVLTSQSELTECFASIIGIFQQKEDNSNLNMPYCFLRVLQLRTYMTEFVYMRVVGINIWIHGQMIIYNVSVSTVTHNVKRWQTVLAALTSPVQVCRKNDTINIMNT